MKSANFNSSKINRQQLEVQLMNILGTKVQILITFALPFFLEGSNNLYSCMIQLVLDPFGAFPT